MDRSPRIVQLVVGPQRHTFFVPEKLLRNRIEYFKAHLDSIKGAERRLEYPKEDPTAFGYILDWVYGEGPVLKGPFEEEDDPEGSDTISVVVKSRMLLYSKLYVLASKLGVSELASQAAKYICGATRMNYNSWGSYLLRTVPNYDGEAIIYLYDNTLATDPIRKFLALILIEQFFERELEEYEDNWGGITSCHPDFQKDVNDGIREQLLLLRRPYHWNEKRRAMAGR